MKDVEGNSVKVGDIVRVLKIREDIPLDDEERPHVLAMLNNDYEIDEIVNGNTQVSVSITIPCEEGCVWTGLYLYPNEFRLIDKKEL